MALREVTEGDLAIFFEHQRDPEASRMARFTPRDRDAFMAHWRENVLGEGEAEKKTILAEDGDVAGNIVSWSSGGKRLLGYWIGKAHWGRGVATAAVRAFVKDTETRRPLHAYVASQNVGSIRVLEKCGFRQVGNAHTGADGVEEVLMRLDAV